jgi:two-component system, OmpR family, response regulator
VPDRPELPVPAPRVLVVDDEPAIRELLAMICAYEGWEVRTAAAGEAALREVGAQPPDVVLLDMMLPDLDGPTVLRRIHAVHPGLPVIMVTARDSADDRASVLAAGAAGYVIKPFGVAALTDEVRRALDPAPATAPATAQVAATTPVASRTASSTPAATR